MVTAEGVSNVATVEGTAGAFTIVNYVYVYPGRFGAGDAATLAEALAAAELVWGRMPNAAAAQAVAIALAAGRSLPIALRRGVVAGTRRLAFGFGDAPEDHVATEAEYLVLEALAKMAFESSCG